jgi:hypothetical protein
MDQSIAAAMKEPFVLEFINDQPKSNKTNFKNLLRNMMELGYEAGVSDARKITMEALR